MNVKTIGSLVRNARKQQGLTQAEAAGYMNVGSRFLSELENGKPTVQMEKALRVIESIGFEIFLVPKTNTRLIRCLKENLK
jgi:HTH-type transcriptional regulator / antitoxin HipB